MIWIQLLLPLLIHVIDYLLTRRLKNQPLNVTEAIRVNNVIYQCHRLVQAGVSIGAMQAGAPDPDWHEGT